jgi:TonB-linked SusC/RagA family outer membrane protein
MLCHSWRQWCATSVLGIALMAAGARGAHAQQGTVSGRVTDRATNRPVEQVQVAVVGTTLGALTNADGAYTIRGVPAGTASVRALRVGYGEQRQTVTVAAGQAATANFAMESVPVSLAPVVTTATGEQRRVEIGNAVSTVNVAEVTQTAPVANLADVLQSRAPGVVVSTGGQQTGSGARIRIRGQSSLALSNDPIYIIDGVRMTSNSNSSAFGTGGSIPSRVGDLNPEEIESLEVVKGPSAATLYGTDAANGVIVITTKKGRSGAAKWTVYGEGGVLADRNAYPTAYSLAGHSPGATAYRDCVLSQVASGNCVADSVRSLNLFKVDSLTPVDLGNRQQLGAQVSGGSDAVRYFLAGEREQEVGTLKLPEFERNRFIASNLPIRDYVNRPNQLEKNSFRANLNATINPKLDVSVSSGFIALNQRFSLESNATAGVGSQAFGGRGYIDPNTLKVGGGLGTPLNGYRAWTPGYTWQETNGQRVNRFIGATNGNWRPASWFQTNANVGLDLTDRVEDNLLRRGEGPPITSTYRLGFKSNWRTDIRNISLDLASAATFHPQPWLNTKTTAGVQYVNYQFDRNEASDADLPPGTSTSGSGAEPSVSEATTLQKTLGLYVEQQLAFRDRLFLTGALRSDQNSAFGTDFQNVIYPKASLSWIISDEDFFPRLGWLNQLRLRSAYGASGVQPGPNDALRTFEATTINVKGSDRPGVRYTAVGNPKLKPEKTTEFETGFETRLFSSRASLDLTYYRKRTKDALIDAIVPPSAGAAASVRQNIGATQNTGWEVLLTTHLVDKRWLGFDVAFNGSTNSNEVVSLGGTPAQSISNYRKVQEGYPLFSFWAPKILGYQDKNNDGILIYSADPTKNEVFVDTASTFIGYAQPRTQLAVVPGLELFQRRLRLTALLDFRGGHYIWNDTERIRCGSRGNCIGVAKLGAPLDEQARAVALRDDPSHTLAGYMEKGDYLKLREITATYSMPERLVRRAGPVRTASLNFAARNIKWWAKDFTGIDPEIDRVAGADDDVPDQFQTLGLPTTFIFRINLGF